MFEKSIEQIGSELFEERMLKKDAKLENRGSIMKGKDRRKREALKNKQINEKTKKNKRKKRKEKAKKKEQKRK